MSDRPVTDLPEDLLGRWGLAKTIFDLISSADTNSALRIGVYGRWGEGKTSVLRFVEAQAKRANLPVCWFSVWSAQTQQDLGSV
jgi:predicted KAP-like P-loop ATPase